MNNHIVAGFDDDREPSLEMRLEKIEHVPGCLVVNLEGYIDAYNHRYFQKQVTKAIDAGFTRLVLVMRGINYIGSPGVGSLVFLMNTLRSKSGDLVLQELQPKVHEVLELLGYTRFFSVSRGLEESLAHLTREPAAPVFPRLFRCPICEVRLRAARVGRFRCARCRSVILLAGSGAAALA